MILILSVVSSVNYGFFTLLSPLLLIEIILYILCMYTHYIADTDGNIIVDYILPDKMLLMCTNG